MKAIIQFFADAFSQVRSMTLVFMNAFRKREFVAVPGFVYSVGVYVQKFAPQKFFLSQLAARYRKALEAPAASKLPPGSAEPGQQNS